MRGRLRDAEWMAYRRMRASMSCFIACEIRFNYSNSPEDHLNNHI